jgi:hypothetical protein
VAGNQTPRLKETPMTNSWVPRACTLPTADQPLRVAEFDTLFSEHLQRVDSAGPLKSVLVFDGVPGMVERIENLSARESSCCSFFQFTTRPEGAAVVLEVSVPEPYADVLTGLRVRAEAAVAFHCGAHR